jgi:hypothetical protein
VLLGQIRIRTSDGIADLLIAIRRRFAFQSMTAAMRAIST